VIWTFAGEVPGRNPMQFVVQRRREFVERGVIAGTQLFEQLWHGGTHAKEITTGRNTGARLFTQPQSQRIFLRISLHTDRTTMRLNARGVHRPGEAFKNAA